MSLTRAAIVSVVIVAIVSACSSSKTAARDVGSVADLRPAADAHRDAAADLAVDAATTADAKGTALPRHLYVAENGGTIWAHPVAADGSVGKGVAADRTGAFTFIAFHPTRALLYATRQANVFAFALGGVDGKATFVGQGASGANGTHLAVDGSGKYIFVASYGGDQLSMLPLDGQGRPKAATITRGGPTFCVRAHQVRVSRSNRFVYVPCLGSDHVAVLRFDAAAGTLTTLTPAKVKAGSGPRHMDFHPTKDLAYVINEKASTITVFTVDAGSGALTDLQTISTLPKGVTAPSRSSDIHVSPDGKRVYGVNREPQNNVAVFDVGSDGKLTLVGHSGTGGNHARTFAIHPRGDRVYVGNSKSNSVVTFSVAPSTGLLTETARRTFSRGVYFVGLR